MAHKPVYQVKQKVLTSLAWRCCPGYTGPNCEHHDSVAIPEPADPGDGHQEPGDGPISFQPGVFLIRRGRQPGGAHITSWPFLL
ncbi:Multimerin-2 [Saguinus oedipus]|uniref:Multimerin-2 n=1 Tax=Saguinus oedipus TaxID=9490 RepID=A0ABQ9UMC3_SAGOE|nr:Multimerin-2 [Saguinus oedipus]